MNIKFILLSSCTITVALALSFLTIPSSELLPNGRTFLLLAAFLSSAAWTILASLIILALKQYKLIVRAIFTIPVFIHPVLWILATFSLFRFSDETLKPFAYVFFIAFALLAAKTRAWGTVLCVVLLSLLAFIGDVILLFYAFHTAAGEM